eukprot:2441588-Pyramimonas_sp.AAC.3
MMHLAQPFIEKEVHPTVVVRGYMKALQDAIKVLDEIAFPIDVNDSKCLLVDSETRLAKVLLCRGNGVRLSLPHGESGTRLRRGIYSVSFYDDLAVV